MFLNGEYYWFSSETGRKYRGRNTGNVQLRGGLSALVVRFAGLSQPFLVKNIKKSCPARIFLLRKTAIIRCFLYICKIWVMRDTVCHCHPCDAYESLSEQTENNAFTCHP